MGMGLLVIGLCDWCGLGCGVFWVFGGVLDFDWLDRVVVFIWCFGWIVGCDWLVDGVFGFE